eukprot:gene3432-biopygen18747
MPQHCAFQREFHDPVRSVLHLRVTFWSYDKVTASLTTQPVKKGGPPLAWARTPGSLGPGAWGAGAATLACQKNHVIISSDTGNLKKWQVDRRLRFRHTDLKTPLVERIPVVHLWASPGA